MNIFVLDLNPTLCATYHCDTHVGKMAMEASQLLSNAHWRYNPKANKLKGLSRSSKMTLCRPSHMNHPCAVWVRESRENYEWLFKLYVALHKEFMHRRGKAHANYFRVDSLRQAPVLLDSRGMTPFALAMDHEYKVDNDARASPNEALLLAVQSYRNYYKHGKMHLHGWTKREIPEWIR